MPKDFMIVEFEALREEILRLQSGVVRILSIGIGAVPLIIGASLKFNLDPVIYVSPLIVGVIMLILLFEQNGIMRAGRYIRLYIEPLVNKDEFIGWETFLETKKSNRNAEVFFASASYAIFAIYYIGGTFLAYEALLSSYNEKTANFITSFYFGGFIIAMYLVYKFFPISTLNPGEDRPRDPLG